jgi:hypothetical protein
MSQSSTTPKSGQHSPASAYETKLLSALSKILTSQDAENERRANSSPVTLSKAKSAVVELLNGLPLKPTK